MTLSTSSVGVPDRAVRSVRNSGPVVRPARFAGGDVDAMDVVQLGYPVVDPDQHLTRQIDGLPRTEVLHGLFAGQQGKDATVANRQRVSGQRDPGGLDGDDPLRAEKQVNLGRHRARSGKGFHAPIQPELVAHDNPPGYPRMLKLPAFTPSPVAIPQRQA